MNDRGQELEEVATTCCVVGGGPAGMMLGFLLARAGVEVVVLEKHGDFLRDFRGDTVHPSTLELIAELGLLEPFLALPHQEAPRLKLVIGDREIDGPDFTRLPTRCKFIALMPQWDFLDFLAAQGRRLPAFDLRMRTEVESLVLADGRVAGVRARSDRGAVTVRADLVVAADGRHSAVRALAGMKVREFGVPIDVLWFRLSKPPDQTSAVLGRVRGGRIMITLDRGDYFQCGSIIPKGSFERMRGEGLAAFRAGIVSTAPFLRDSVDELRSWDQVKLLTVQVNRLPVWHRPGLLCIGDAAHAMSPAGGVGVNLAVQDAVATANLLAGKLRRHAVADGDLAAVQRRREMPVRLIQTGQVFIHRRMFGPDGEPFPFSWPTRKLIGLLAPLLRRAAARLAGVGFRPEHIRG